MTLKPSDRWIPKLRWFAAEYLIVVVGVLTAFAMSAWWQSREERGRERSYLQQLSSELQTTVALMDQADSESMPWERSHARIIQAFYADTITPRDSIYDWMGQSLAQPNIPNPVLGTAKALSSTGDLRLIRDDALRFEISTYVEVSELEAEKQLRYFDMFFTAVRVTSAQLDPSRFHTAYHPHFDTDNPPGVGSTSWFPAEPDERFSPSAEQILENRDLLGSLVTIANAHENGRVFRRAHRQRAVQLLERIEAELRR